MLVLRDDSYQVALYHIEGSEGLEYVEETEREEFTSGLAEAVRERGHGDGKSHHAVVLVYYDADHVLVDEGHILADVHLDLFVGQAGELVQDGVGVVEDSEDFLGSAGNVLYLARHDDGQSVFLPDDLVVGG